MEVDGRVSEMEDCVLMCANCGKRLSFGDYVWKFLTVNGDGMKSYSPACSYECANDQMDKNAEMHRARLYEVEHQAFQVMKGRDYVHT